MSNDTTDSIFAFANGTTSANTGNHRYTFQNVAVVAFSGALALSLLGTTSVSALPTRATPQIIASGSTHSSALYAQAYPSGSVATPTSQIRELHRRSGLTWEQIAQIFGADRRTVHLWASGRPMRATQAEKLSRIMGVLTKFDRGSPTLTRDFLLTASFGGKLLIDLMQEGQFREIASAAFSEAPVNRWTRMRRPPRLSADTAKLRRDLTLPEMLGGEDDETEIG